MVRIREAIVVEGRYDQNALRQIVDAPVFRTDGFALFKNPEQMALLRRVAQKRGLIVLTDSDGAGLVIRNRLRGGIPGQYLKHAYIPDVPGKERRKARPGKEGKLGVEGMPPEILLEALRRAGATVEGEEALPPRQITKQDLMELGLSGTPNAAARRAALQRKCGFPEKMSANALLEALNLLYSREELAALCENGEPEW